MIWIYYDLTVEGGKEKLQISKLRSTVHTDVDAGKRAKWVPCFIARESRREIVNICEAC
jgi:hypothetical protein